MVFSERLACAECGISFPEVSPRMFSFNNPYGACPECGGIGTRCEIDPERLVPESGALAASRRARAVGGTRVDATSGRRYASLAKRYKFSLDDAVVEAPQEARGTSSSSASTDDGFEGVVKILDRRYRETLSEDARAEVETFMAVRPCPACGGSRLRPESLGRQDRGPVDRRRRALHHQGRRGSSSTTLTLTERETRDRAPRAQGDPRAARLPR